jgi:hypothetical protein
VGADEPPGDEPEDGVEESMRNAKPGAERKPRRPGSAATVSLAPWQRTLFSRP